MKEIKPISDFRKSREGYDRDGYYLVQDSDGVMKCSCGRQLEKMDDETYRCSGGYPIYRFSEGSVIVDKFGNLMIKEVDHSNNKNNEKSI